MKGDITTKRARRPMWVRWEATEELGGRCWYVAYGFTKRGAIKAVKRRTIDRVDRAVAVADGPPTSTSGSAPDRSSPVNAHTEEGP